MVTNENNVGIQEALDQLPNIQREAIILKYYRDLKVKDTAKATGVTTSTAQSRINQGLKKLARILDKEDSSIKFYIYFQLIV